MIAVIPSTDFQLAASGTVGEFALELLPLPVLVLLCAGLIELVVGLLPVAMLVLIWPVPAEVVVGLLPLLVLMMPWPLTTGFVPSQLYDWATQAPLHGPQDL